jgi:hypothetical protein
MDELVVMDGRDAHGQVIVQFESTYGAIERVALPLPLESDRTAPPAVLFSAPPRRGDRVVVVGSEFVDALNGESTELTPPRRTPTGPGFCTRQAEFGWLGA